MFKVIGIRNIDFTDKNDETKRVKGVSLCLGRPIRDGEGVYSKDDKVFISEWFLTNRLYGELPKLGDEIDIFYNKDGKLTELRILEPVK